MKLKNKILTSILAASSLASTALVATTITSCSKTPSSPITPEQEKIFEIKDGVLLGFKSTATEQEKKDYCKDGILRLPAVKVIGENAFNTSIVGDAPYITGIEIKADTYTIGKKAFYGNRATSITWENGVESSSLNLIGEEAFAFCTQLESFAFPKGLFTEDTAYGIKENAFFGCGKLATLDLHTFDSDPDNYINTMAWATKDAFDGISQSGKVIFTKPTASLDTKEGKLRMYNCAHMFTRLVVAGLNSNWKEHWKTDSGSTEWTKQIKIVPHEWLNIGGDINYTLWGATDDWKTGDRAWNTVLVPPKVKAIGTGTTVTDSFFNARTRKSGETDTGIDTWLFNWSNIVEVPADTFKNRDETGIEAYWPETLTTIGDNAFNKCYWNNDFPNQEGVTSIGINAFTNSVLTGWKFGATTICGNSAFNAATVVTTLDFTNFTATPTNWGTSVFSGCGTLTGVNNKVWIKEYTNVVDQWRIRYAFQEYLRAKVGGQGLNLGDGNGEWSFQPKGTMTLNDLFNIDSTGKLLGWAKGTAGELSKDEVTVILAEIYPSFDGTLTIPDKINDISVTAIDANAFKEKLPDTVTTLVFPATTAFTTVGANAFENNTSLTKVVFKKNMTLMGKEAFKGCSALATLDFTNFAQCTKDWYGPWTTGTDIFTGCAASGTILVHDYSSSTYKLDQWRQNWPIKAMLTNIGGITTWDDTHWKFDHADSAILVTIDASNVVTGWATGTDGVLTELEKVYLANDKYNAPTLMIPAEATSIAEYAFYDKTNAKSTIPAGLTKIAFATSSACATIGSHAFYQAWKGLTVTGGASVDLSTITASSITVADHAFDSANITALTLNSKITAINEAAFSNTGITSLVMPKFAAAITFGDGAFAHNLSLAYIDMSAYGTAVPTDSEWLGSKQIFDEIATTGQIKVDSSATAGIFKDFLAARSDTISAPTSNWTEVTA